jgi:hypothetical protein
MGIDEEYEGQERLWKVLRSNGNFGVPTKLAYGIDRYQYQALFTSRREDIQI